MKEKINSLAKNLLPEKTFAYIKQRYRKLRFENSRKISEIEFRNILINNLGLRSGSVVFIHSSINNLLIDFPFSRILEILKDIVGSEGTLLFPTYQINIRAEEHLENDPVFNVKRSPTTMGLLPELARRMKNSNRSMHPFNSVTAIGKLSYELVHEHHMSIYPCGIKSPFYKITAYDGIIIGIGVTFQQSLSFIHCVEDILQDKFPVKTRAEKVYNARVIDHQNNEIIVKTLVPHQRIGYRDIKGYFNKHIPKAICTNKKIAGMDFFIAKSNELYVKMEELALKNITIYTSKAYE